MASGTISFGLVTIPVKMYSTGEASAGVRFNMLHRDCGSRLKQQYICPVHDAVVGRDEMVKGYEYAKGQYVLFSDEELKELSPKPTNAIDIHEFVPLESVDPVYFERAYYLGPDKGGDRPYRLLAEAMLDTGRAALARYATRGKDYLVLLRPFQDGLVMQELRYADEVKSFAEVPRGDVQIRPAELQLAKQLVDQIANEEFHPESYEDEVRKHLRDLIDAKVAGQEYTAAPAEAPKAQIIDLMEALKASLAGNPKPSPAARQTTTPSEAASTRKPPRRSPLAPAAKAGEASPSSSASSSAPKRARAGGKR
jgi:DNA end-binding protein Ku